MISILVRSGSHAGARYELDQDVVRVGRAADNDVVLPDAHVSAHHLRLTTGPSGTMVEDLGSGQGSWLLVGRERRPLAEAASATVPVESGCCLELGSDEQTTTLELDLEQPLEPQVVSTRRIEEIPASAAALERDGATLPRLYEVQKRIGAAEDLADVLCAIADGVLLLLPRATHVTITLRDETSGREVFVPVLVRVRGPDGAGQSPAEPVPLARSVCLKVVRERAAVLAAEASRVVADAGSILGASIRSVVAVPLWRGEHVLGVIQADNRTAPAMLTVHDLDVLAVLGANASLAVANARLIRRLQTAQDRLRHENAFLRTRETGSRGRELLGKSQAVQDLLLQIDKVAATRATVLVEGETGTGKELIARTVHDRSPRRDKLFVAQNCASLPEHLLESELFGHRRGAFTGATEDKKGLFDIADGGTLFLDEIAELPLGMQSKLLRALQEGEVRPVGATSAHSVDVRIVAATNRDLGREVGAGRFREDLYYRLRVYPLRAVPLRERREDIPLLARTFLGRYAAEIGKTVGGLGQAAIDRLVAHDWPGNVRELENEVQRLVIQAEEGAFVLPELLSEHVRGPLPLGDGATGRKGTLRERMDRVEKAMLVEVLREHANNKTSTAKTLGMSREGLHKKLRYHGL